MNATPNWGMTRVLGWGAAGVVALAAVTGIAEATSRTGTSSAPAVGSEAPAAQVAPAASKQQTVPAGRPAAAAVQANDGAAMAGRRKGCVCKRGAPRRPVHGELVVPVKDGFRTVRVQRGEVTESKASSLTVKSPDGYTATWSVDRDTRVRKQGKEASLTEVKAGDRVLVRGPKTEDGATARIVRAHTPKQAVRG